MQYPSSASLLQAWELAATERHVRRPLSWLSAAFGWARTDLESLSLGERDRLILQARCLMFGKSMTGLVECRSCKDLIEFQVPIESLLDAPKASSDPIGLDGEGYQLQLRPVRAGDVEALHGREGLRERLFKRCVMNGTWQEANNEAVIQAAGERLALADPLADITVDLICPTCRAEFSPRFDPWRFFWEELDVWARRLMRQVHVLASAYGWTEDQVLALSATRRAIYLQMVKG